MVLLLHLCSPTAVLNALAPRDGVTPTRNIAYADGPRHRLDIYAPLPAVTPAPVIVFFYGGGWASGSKAMYRFVGAGLAARGVLVVIPDYRLYPEVRFPAFMDDAATAVAWTRANASRFGGDPRRLFLMGHSAGAQIATLLALDAGYLRSVHLSPRRDVCGVIGLAGPYDFLPLRSATLRDVFGPKRNDRAPNRSTMFRRRPRRCCCWQGATTSRWTRATRCASPGGCARPEGRLKTGCIRLSAMRR